MGHKKRHSNTIFENSEDATKSFTKIPQEDSEIKINSKKFEEDVREHYSRNHETEVSKKLDAIVSEVFSEEEAPSEIDNDVKPNETQIIDEKKIYTEKKKDRIDEQLDKCFSENTYNDKVKKLKRSERNNSNESDNFSESIQSGYEEYTNVSQNLEIIGRLRSETSKTFKNLIAVFMFAVISVCVDLLPALGVSTFKILQPGKYTTVFSLISLQLLFICVMFSLDSMKKGAINLFKSNSTPESAAFLTVAIVSIHAIITSFFCYESTIGVTFCSIGSVSLFLLKVYEYLKYRSALMSFQVISLKDTKYVASKCESNCEESKVFEKYLAENSEILQIEECSFISSFFKNSAERSKNDRSIPLLTAISFVGSAILFALAFFLKHSFYEAFSMFIACFVTVNPLSIYIVNSLPLFSASKKAFKLRSAIVGETACEKFSSAAVMSFEDTLVFPPKSVKVTSMKTYGTYKIDNIIILMAKIFKVVGGPLSLAFANSVSSSDISGNVVLTEVSPDGLTLGVDGEEYIIGTRSFLNYNGLDTPVDNFDDSFINSSGSVLFLAKKNSLAAKFYIKYTINPQFEHILNALYKEGICAGIKSVDPCINNELININMSNSKCPISVVKKLQNHTLLNNNTISARIVSASTPSNFLRTFVLSSKLKQLFSANYVIKIIGFVISLIAVLAFAFTGNITKVTIALALLFQLIWLVPILLVSTFYKWD